MGQSWADSLLKLFGVKPKVSNVPHRKLPDTAQNSIPFRTVFRDGTIETTPDTYTRAYDLQDINFKIAPDAEQVSIFRAYGDFLNSFAPTARFQIVIQNYPANKRASMEDIHFKMQRDGLNPLRQEMNQILLERLSEGRKNLKQDKYLVVSVKDTDIDRAMSRLATMDKEIEKAIHRIAPDVDVHQQTIEERLHHLFDIYNQDGESVFYNDMDQDGHTPRFSYDKLGQYGISAKDLICPPSFMFRPDSFKTGRTFGRVLFLERVPTWLSTDFLSDLSDVPVSMILSITHQPIATEKAMRMVKDHMTAVNAQIAASQKTAVRSGYTYDLLPPDLALSQKQTRDLMDDLMGRDQKLYYLTFTVCLFAETLDKLEEYTRMVTSIAAGKHLCPLRTLSFQQEQGLDEALPLCLHTVAVQRLFTTESASIFIPYSSLELYQKNGIYYGMNQTSNNMILYDRLSGRNYNGLIFGESGTGKSFAAKMEMLSVRLRHKHHKVYVIDPQAEYIGLARRMGGEIIDLSPGSRTYVNPLDMDIDYDGESDPVSMKLDYIVSMIEIMLGQGKFLDPQAKSIVGRCVNTIYRPYLQHINQLRQSGVNISCDKEAMPTLNSLYNELLRQPEPAAQTVASVLEVYATGSFATFAHRSNVDTDNDFVVYDVKNLGTGMKDLGLHVCLNDIWNKMIENHRKGPDYYTWIYIDEFYLLLQSDSAARFLMQVWKRCRHHHGVPMGIMQNTEDLLRSADSRNILNNTSFIIMNSLSKLDRTNLADLLQIPDSQLSYITNSTPGRGLIYNGKTVLPYLNEIPKSSSIYKLLNTTENNGDQDQRFVT